MMDSAIDHNNSSGSDEEEVKDDKGTTINERVIYQAALQVNLNILFAIKSS